jgi:hypothetical protein
VNHLLRHHERTRDAADRIVTLEAWYVTVSLEAPNGADRRSSTPGGEREDTERRQLFRGSK